MAAWLATLLLAAALPQAAPAMFTGVHTVHKYSVEDSAADKTATVTCPAGERVLSAGYYLNRADGSILLDDVRPDSTLTKVTVRAAEDETGTTETWAVGASAVCAPPPPGLVRVSAVSSASSVAKVARATCPAGKKVVGTGGEVANGTGQVVIDGIVPSADLSRVTINAFEDQTGTAAQWSLAAYAICATVAGLERSSASTGASSNSNRSGAAGCGETGKRPIGGGSEIDGGGGQVVLFTNQPDTYAVYSMAHEDDTGYEGNWGVTVYAICGPTALRSISETATNPDPKGAGVNCNDGQQSIGVGGEIDGAMGEAWFHDLGFAAPTLVSATAGSRTTRGWLARGYAICATPLPGLEYAEAPGLGSPPFSDRTSTPTCPAGKKVVGVGVQTANFEVDVMYQALAPSPGLQGAQVAMSEVENPQDTAWDMSGQVVCATPPPGLELIARTTPTDSDENKSVTAACPAGKHLLGTGAAVTPRTGDVVIDDLRPDERLTKVTVTGLEDRNGFQGAWSAQAYAICVSR